MLATGKRLTERYEILGPLGKGGMGEVYRARDLRLKREVAVKILPDHLSKDQNALSRFEREATSIATLSHPNILAIYDFGADQGIAYAVMELLEGETLRSLLSRVSLSWQRTVEIGISIADGLAAAHSKGIIHRDIKPENIFLTSEGHVKILDFGLARQESSRPPEVVAEVPTQSYLTQEGTVLGTVPYMSPEQVRGLALDARSDLFSLGCILYEMLAAKRPFDRGTAADTMAAILKEDPAAISESGQKIPFELDRLIRRCLEKNPDQRFQTARDLAFDLRHGSRFVSHRHLSLQVCGSQTCGSFTGDSAVHQ